MAMDSKSNIITNSPVEFVLVGPLRGRDKILLSSDNAGLDIKGLAATRDADDDSLQNQSSIFSIFLSSARQFNVLESYNTHDIDSDYDKRKSSFRFAWVGYCPPGRRERIQDLLNRTIPDIRRAILEDEETDMELAISPVILNCSVAHQRRLRSRRFMLATLVIYALVGISVAISNLVFQAL